MRVFLSYSHDSAAHAERVLALADRLRQDGIDAWIDQYEPEPTRGWPRWMVDEIEKADRVLAICTETYRRRFEGKETAGGLGVRWEGAILTGELYRDRDDFVQPVVFEHDDLEHLPTALRDLAHHVVDGESGYLALYRRLTDQPETPAPPLGKPKALAPKPRRSAFGLLSRVPSSPVPAETGSVAAYRAWAADRYGHLDLVGLAAGDVRLGLDEIYVPLRILERSERLEGEGKRLREQAFAGMQQTLELDRLFLHLGGAPGARHALIFGEAGSGKTTALRKLHQLVLETGDTTALGLASGTLPVFLRLRRLTPELIEHGLGDFLERELEELSGATLSAGVGTELWRRRRLLLLLDGLDEIADPRHRSKVLARLAWWLQEPELADVRAVISCRYAGWSTEVRELGVEIFQSLDVRPFDDEQIARLVELWFREVGRRGYLEPTLAGERARQLTRVLTHPEHRRQEFLVLVSTPLLLTLLCLVVMRGGEIPRRRVDFFEECLRILLREWWARKGQREPPVSSERALNLLGALAWELHSSHRRDDLTFPQARKLFNAELGNPERASAVFRWLLDDVALLDRYDERHYGFVHLGFQEHLAARHLARHEELLEQVCAERDDAWWREVIELLAGLPGGKGFAPLVRRLLATDVPLRRADLLATCLNDASDPDLEPFYEVLRGEGESERKIAVLRLLRGRTEPALIALAQRLVEIGPAQLRAMAQQVVDAARAPADARRADVFLIHTGADRRPAERLAELLERRGYRVDRPMGGEAWDEPRVVERMSGCATLLVLLGTELPEPKDVMDLLELEAGEAVVVTMPGEPRPELPEPFAELRRVDLCRFDDERMIDALVATRLPLAAAAEVGVGKLLAPEIGKPFTEPLTGELFLPVPAGRFCMGGEALDDEKPIHWVQLSALWLARTPVTNHQYRLFREATGHEEPPTWRDRRFSGPEQPVVNVSWHDAMEYCRWLSEQSPTGRVFQLPSEAQWESAARGMEGWEYPWGMEPPDERRACFGRNPSDGQPAPVGSFPTGASPFGHLDLAGNVWEWCRDLWEPNYRRWAQQEPVDPLGEADAEMRPLRGGAWWGDAAHLRSACRSRSRPSYRRDFVGFRVACPAASTGS